MTPLSILFAALTTQTQANPPGVFLPNTRQIAYIGRFDFKEAAPRCSWPASTIAINTDAKNVSVTFQASSRNDRWQIEIDGQPSSVLKLSAGKDTYRVATDLPKGRHLIRLVRRTESNAGITGFFGFELNPGAKLYDVARKRRRIEIIGDSISAGFGVEGKNQNEAYSYETANAYLTYGQVAARDLDAECTIIAWSGKKMWPDNTIPEIYDLNLPTDPESTWTPAKGQEPQAVVINLATNDFGRSIPDRIGWTAAYGKFVKKIRAQYPRSVIYMAIGSMMSDGWPVGKKHLSTLRDYLKDVLTDLGERDKRLKILEFETQNVERDGSGSAWHPNAKTNRNMANRLVEALRRDLRW